MAVCVTRWLQFSIRGAGYVAIWHEPQKAARIANLRDMVMDKFTAPEKGLQGVRTMLTGWRIIKHSPNTKETTSVLGKERPVDGSEPEGRLARKSCVVGDCASAFRKNP
ncbi:hypothetical protein E4U21_002779 [Claviceps maximensis]|nr:hypothetical protein E4U21_002779 [Claviceps maximensis]